MPPAKKKTSAPEGVKQPTDHRSKATESEATGVLSAKVRGHEFSVPAEALDDLELIDELNQLSNDGNALAIPSLLRRLLPDLPADEKADRPAVSQWSIAMNLARDPESKRVTVQAGEALLGELMEALDPNS